MFSAKKIMKALVKCNLMYNYLPISFKIICSFSREYSFDKNMLGYLWEDMKNSKLNIIKVPICSEKLSNLCIKFSKPTKKNKDL